MKRKIKAIMAISDNGVIGQKNGKGEFVIPWKLSEDRKNFRNLTRDQAVVMGWHTWQSLSVPNRPLPHRLNFVLSRGERELNSEAILINTIDQILSFSQDSLLETFIIGGAQVYETFEPYIDEWHLTTVEQEFHGADAISLSPAFRANFLEGFESIKKPIRWEKNEYPAVYEVFRRIK